MQYPSQAAKNLAERLNGVEIGDEYSTITPEDKANGLVVVYGASDDLMEFVGAIEDEIDCCDGGTAYIINKKVLDEGNFECGCIWAEKARLDAIAQASTIDALWCEVDGYSWTYQTDIPHVCFDVMEDGEKYCRGIVFDLGSLEQKV